MNTSIVIYLKWGLRSCAVLYVKTVYSSMAWMLEALEFFGCLEVGLGLEVVWVVFFPFFAVYITMA